MKIVIVGAGPAGLMTAIYAGKNKDNKIIIIDKNEKVGKKLFITGKGRCNVCNYCSNEKFLENVVNNSKFLYSAINNFSPMDTFNFFDNNGTKLKVERGGRVFPKSDKSSDIIKCLTKSINNNNTTILLNTTVLNVYKKDNGFVVKTNKENIVADCVVLCTGGKSYSQTGSTGDGYNFAKNLGHNIISPKPALVPILLKNYDGSLSGLTLKNVQASVIVNNKKYSQFGEMLFTHTGVSGPIILTLSSFLNKYNIIDKNIYIDLKPALDEKTLDERLIRDFNTFKNKALKNYLKELMPSSLINYFIKCGNFNENQEANAISKNDRKKIIELLKNLPLTIKGLDNIDFGIVTSGGVDTKQINPKNMESKLIKNLFFAGEVVDVDALTGGFNIQIALSLGNLVGNYLKNKGEDF